MNKQPKYLKIIFATMLVFAMSIGGVVPALANDFSFDGMYGLFTYTEQQGYDVYHLYIHGDDGMNVDGGEVWVDPENAKQDQYYPCEEDVMYMYKKYNISTDYCYDKVTLDTDWKMIHVKLHKKRVIYFDLTNNEELLGEPDSNKYEYVKDLPKYNGDVYKYYRIKQTKQSFTIGWATKDGGRCYYTTDEGDLATGWKKIDNTWYYFNKDGIMQTGWLNDNGWYYLKDGKAVTGWEKVDGTWYFFNDSCKMLTGWVKDNGTWYYLKDSGAMSTGWTKVGGEWYFLADSGAMKTGWLKDGGTWYYLLDSGTMAKDRWVGNYYFYSNGAMAVNTWIGRYHVNWNGQWDRTW